MTIVTFKTHLYLEIGDYFVPNLGLICNSVFVKENVIHKINYKT